MDNAKCFNDGSDARLMGLPLEDCPYLINFEIYLWSEGWHNVDKFWGKDARWPVRPLPELITLQPQSSARSLQK